MYNQSESAELISLKKENSLLLRKLEKYERDNPSIIISQNIIDMQEEQLDIFYKDLYNLTTELTIKNQENKQLKKNNTALKNRLTEVTHQLSKKLYTEIEYDDFDSVAKMKNALLNCSEKLGIAQTQIVFLKNQLSKDALKISQQTKLLSAAKHKEDDTAIKMQEKIEKIKDKNRQSILYYRNIGLADDQKIETLLRGYPQLTTIGDLSLQKKCLILEKDNIELIEEYKRIKKEFYNIINKLEKIRDESSVLYLQKIHNYQQEIRTVRESLEKTKIMYENIKLELQTERLIRK